MPISFSCHKCGKRLKAPKSAVGKTSKCPGCGTPVTCPQPVYKAEPAEADLPEILDDEDERDPYGFGDGNPYAVQQPPATERRRPCPMCGELILASAVKCRYCGEVVDEAITKPRKKRAGRGEDVLTGLDWAIGVLAVVANLVLAVVYVTRGHPKGNKLLIMAICANAYWGLVWFVIRSLP